VNLRLESGQGAVGLAFDGNLLRLTSPVAFAPGSPIRFKAPGEHGDRNFEGRVLRSKRVQDERFEVQLRLVNLRRQDRELLLSALQP